jgi:hypothetical protein
MHGPGTRMPELTARRCQDAELHSSLHPRPAQLAALILYGCTKQPRREGGKSAPDVPQPCACRTMLLTIAWPRKVDSFALLFVSSVQASSVKLPRSQRGLGGLFPNNASGDGIGMRSAQASQGTRELALAWWTGQATSHTAAHTRSLERSACSALCT